MRWNPLPLTTLVILILLCSMWVSPETARGQMLFNRGDCNTDGVSNIADVVHGLGILFSGAGPANCADACDVNDDGGNDISDPIFMLGNLFSGGPNPPLPDDCGPDPTPDSLDCLIGPANCPPPFANLDLSLEAGNDPYASLIDIPSTECSSYDLVEPAESQNSWLYRKINGTHIDAATAAGCDLGDAGTQMPLGPFCCLDQATIDLFQQWIDEGANP